MKRFLSFFLSIIICCCFVAQTLAQQGSTISLKGEKPPENTKTVLRSEKTGYDKLPPVKKFLQNTYVHYNYLFNANQIFNSIMQDAIAANVDDYSQLLNFYPYDEKALAANRQFDSVIQHATEGLLLHDLRNDYVDELYFVLGKSFYFERKLDTAQRTFQYINYAFAPKDDGYNIPIGSNVSNRDDKTFSISNKESDGFFKKNNLKNIHRRNDALLWLARNFTDEKNYTDANMLLNNLGRDIYFPERLKALFYETNAYFFYRQKMYDSAAIYLSQCNFSADTKGLKSRRYYLTAQLYQLSGNNSLAINFYNQTLQEANNPELEIYAQKNIIQLRNKNNASGVEENELNHLLKKNKYYQYKDLIYYNQAEIADLNNDDKNAKILLKQSIQENRITVPQNPVQKSRSFLLLGDIQYNNYRFDSASHDYDSVSANYIKDSLARESLQTRLAPLKLIAANCDSIYFQDSLLTLANMPEKERMAILKQKAKQIRRAIDKREENDTNVPVNGFANQTQKPIDLFAQQGGSAVWYFNNPAAKSSGYQLFRQKFGNRPNVDNWQRASALQQNIPVQNNSSQSSLLNAFNANGTLKTDSVNITAEDLLATLPMTDTQKEAATDTINSRMLNNGEILMNQLENFTGAIVLFDSLINKYPKSKLMPNALYDKFVCYTLLGNKDEANNMHDKLMQNYPANQLVINLKNKMNDSVAVSQTSIKNIATKAYSDIYDLFLAGKFDEALQRKSVADNKYGKFYWTSQLLYIEAIYYATKRNDSAAFRDLFTIVSAFPASPIVPLAKNMINVLQHRNEIESYLARLNIKPEDYNDANMLAELENGAQRMQKEQRIAFPKDSLVKYDVGKITNESQDVNNNAQQLVNQQSEDTSQNIAANNLQQNNLDNQSIDSTNKQTQNANNNADITNNFVVNKPAQKIDTAHNENKIVKARPDRMDTTNLSNKQVAVNNSTINPPENVAKNNPVQQNQPANVTKPEIHSTRTFGGFSFDDNSPTYVTVVLDNVDPIFASEATNAFNRYNLLTFPNKNYTVRSQKIGDQNLVLIGPFKNMQEAKDYQVNVQPHANVEIISWITPDNYSFIKISPQNLSKIHSKDDLQQYKNAAAQAGSE